MVSGCLLPGQTRSNRFVAEVTQAVSPGPLTATATVGTFRTLPGSAGVQLAAAADGFDTNGAAGVDEPGDDRVVLTRTAVAPVLVFTLRVTDLNGGTVEPTDRIRYDIVVSNTGTGPAERGAGDRRLPHRGRLRAG